MSLADEADKNNETQEYNGSVDMDMKGGKVYRKGEGEVTSTAETVKVGKLSIPSKHFRAEILETSSPLAWTPNLVLRHNTRSLPENSWAKGYFKCDFSDTLILLL